VALVANQEAHGSDQELAEVSLILVKGCVFRTFIEARSNVPKGHPCAPFDNLHGCDDIERQ